MIRFVVIFSSFPSSLQAAFCFRAMIACQKVSGKIVGMVIRGEVNRPLLCSDIKSQI